MTHTPGPWEIGSIVQNDGSIAIKATLSDGEVARLALVDDYGLPQRGDPLRPLAEGQANARLIAAAPALLEALETAELALALIDRQCYDRARIDKPRCQECLGCLAEVAWTQSQAAIKAAKGEA